MSLARIIAVDAASARISDKTVWTFVRVRASDGREGWGEGTLQGRHAEVHAHVDAWSTLLRGVALDAALAQLAAALAPDDLAHATALSALDQAVWDLIAQAGGVPLARALGTPVRGVVELYANINRGTLDRSPEGFAARARDAAQHGFAAIKIAPFDGVTPATAHTDAGRHATALGLARVHAVRAAIGAKRALMVDCHWRFDEAAARDVLHALAPAQLYWFECPLPEAEANFGALRRLKAQANAMGVKTAGCETLTGVDAFRTYLDGGLYDAVMPDVKYAGGLRQMLAVDAAAQAKHAISSPHNPTGPIAHMHSVHVAALGATLPFLEFQYGESDAFFDIVRGALPDPTHGSSHVPDAPGLGIALDPAALAPLIVQGSL
ncbi:MAG: mandelate racemase/muconate lactonizing enzyme family protein [Proteobacteria bacterium]|nr:mandelate racemase/muconate lactonizing enzyme family protein [Pseudomonadota bacterium]